MATQQEYKYDPKAKAEKGDVTINWMGNTYTSRSVLFNTATRGGVVHANYLQLINTKNSKGGTDNDSFLACFLNNVDIPEQFDQYYEAGVTDHPYPWSIFYENIKHFPTHGTITGKFFNGYRKIETEIRMFFADNTSAIILLNAEKL